MIPPKGHPVWVKLIKDTTAHQFKVAAGSMLFFNLRSQYQKDPSRLEVLADEARKFFAKYESILGDDMKRLFG
jgi:hypothetical protein